MEIQLGAAVSPRVPDRPTVLVPVGATEQHGPHLPLDTDAEIAVAVAEAAAKLLRRQREVVVVAPCIAYGSSGEHQDFAGTVSIGTEVLRLLLVELVRSASTWAERVVFVNGHGGNVSALEAAVSQLQVEGHTASWVPCIVPGSDLHAGHTETSLMMLLKPWEVRRQHIQSGNTASLEELMPSMAEHGVRAVAPNGVLGDPRTASREAGSDILQRMACDVAGHVSRALGGPARTDR